jgi:hypothetical protein
MVQYAEIEHGIEARIREGQLFRIPRYQRETPVVLALEPFPCTFDLERVQIHPGNMRCVELLQYHFNTSTSAAAYLQHNAAVRRPAKTA